MHSRFKLRRVLAPLMALILLAGCTTQQGEPAAESGAPAGHTALSMMYMVPLPTFEALVESTYPDIDLQVEINYLATIDGESERRLRNAHGPDIVTTTMPTGDVRNYVLDVSAEPWADAYHAGLSQTLLVDGKTCFIPLPGQYSGFVYNATMTADLGLSAPQHPSDLLAMLDAAAQRGIGQDSAGTSFGFVSNDRTSMSTYFVGTQVPDFLGTGDGILWSEHAKQGQASFADGLAHCTDWLAQCVERGYVNANTLLVSHSNAVPVQKRMQEGTMMLAYGTMKFYRDLCASCDTYAFEMVPFLSEADNPPWTITSPDAYLAMNSALAEEGNEAKRAAASRVLGLLSTEEGQAAFAADTGAAQSYLASSTPNLDATPEGLRACAEQGYVYQIRIPAKLFNYFGTQMIAVLTGQVELDAALAAVDDYMLNGDPEVEYDQTLVGVVEGDMLYENFNTRCMETAIANLVTDAVREATGADIAFVNGGAIRSSLYAGNVYGQDLKAVCPYDNKIVLLDVNAETLRAVLANGLTTLVQESGAPGGRFLSASGLGYSFRAPDGDSPAELVDVWLADGSPLDEGATYTIAVTSYMAGFNGYLDNNGDGFTMLNVYSDTAPLAEGASLREETQLTYADALRAYFEAHRADVISSEIEGRIRVIEE